MYHCPETVDKFGSRITYNENHTQATLFKLT